MVGFARRIATAVALASLFVAASAGAGDPKYVGVQDCGRCHKKELVGNQLAAWKKEKHSSAMKTLESEEATAQRAPDLRLAALSGDLATDHDAQRLLHAGIRARAITTGSACHLDAEMVHHALHQLDWDGADCLFVENVGNLVCPAIYDLGQRANVVALAVTEGEDKPLKYPVMFRAADLVVLTKIDLLPHLPEVSPERIAANLARVMPEPRMLALSARSGEGLDTWLAWLEGLRRGGRSGARGASRAPQSAHSHEHSHSS